MSASPPKADEHADVSLSPLGPITRLMRCSNPLRLLDHLVGGRRWDIEASVVTQRVCARVELAGPANVVLSSGPKIDLSRPSPQPRCVSVGLVRSHMLFVQVKIRRFSGAVSGALFAISVLPAGAFIPASAAAQTGEPVKIGYSMALTGGLGPNGRSALLAQKIWEEDTNAKGGLLGRPVKLIHYDDQTNPATVPGIYTKLLDIDRVDLIIGGYGT